MWRGGIRQAFLWGGGGGEIAEKIGEFEASMADRK